MEITGRKGKTYTVKMFGLECFKITDINHGIPYLYPNMHFSVNLTIEDIIMLLKPKISIQIKINNMDNSDEKRLEQVAKLWSCELTNKN